MRPILTLAALVGAFLLLIGGVSTPAAAQSRLTDEQRAEAHAMREGSKLIGYSLQSAVYARYTGNCYWRDKYLGRARETLAGYRAMHRALPDDDRVTDQDIADAERLLRAESSRPCTPQGEFAAFETAYAALPPLSDTVQPMPSQLPPGATKQEQFEEVDNALNAIYRDTTRCRVEEIRRWLENYREQLRRDRRERDAAIAAGDLSNIDPRRAILTIITMTSILEAAEERFRRYRLACAQRQAQEEGRCTLDNDDQPLECRPIPDPSGCEEGPVFENRCYEADVPPSCDVAPGPGCSLLPPLPDCTDSDAPGCDGVPRCIPVPSGGCDFRLPEETPATPQQDAQPGTQQSFLPPPPSGPDFTLGAAFLARNIDGPPNGIGFQRDGPLGSTPEEFAVTTPFNANLQGFEVNASVGRFTADFEWLEGDSFTSFVIPEGIDSGIVYGALSPEGSTGIATPFGLSGSIATDLRQWEATLGYRVIGQAPDSPLQIFVYVGYGEQRTDVFGQANAVIDFGSGSVFEFGQVRDQRVERERYFGGLAGYYTWDLETVGVPDVSIRAGVRAQVVFSDNTFTSIETNTNNFSLPGDRSFTNEFRDSQSDTDFVSYFELSASWDVNDIIQLYGGIDNLLDEEPPILDNPRSGDDVLNGGRTFPATYDVYGRTFFAGAKFRF